MLLKRTIAFGLTLFSNLNLLARSTTAIAIDHTASTSKTATHLSKRGINCKGSGLCLVMKGRIFFLEDYIGSIEDDILYEDGQHIACYSFGTESMCVFLQKTLSGVKGKDVKKLFSFIVDHGCEACGSAPVMLLEGVNDMYKGELTVNAVFYTECNMTCPVTHKDGTVW